MSNTIENAVILLHPEDTVVVAKKSLPGGTRILISEQEISTLKEIPAGHKVAIRAVAAGDPIIKYGQIIGFASKAIQSGDHVHLHNVEVKDFGRTYEFSADVKAVKHYGHSHLRSFEGFARRKGKVGTRNYLAVISTVNCSASVARFVSEHFREPQFQRNFPHVDGVVAFNHKSGCGIQPGEPLEMLQRVLAGIANHPNICGFVMIGLGCEVNPVCSMVDNHKLGGNNIHELSPVFIDIQKQGGVQKTVDCAVNAIKSMLPFADAMRRSTQPLSKLILAENCGGSDGNSGITANPALGVAADELVRHYGTAVLAETPEIYGAEHLLARRVISEEVGRKLIERVTWWERHVRLFEATIDNNPSLGNKIGGITTIYEKSLGAIAKGGHSPINAVYHYAEPITSQGLCFMDTPGFDPVSMTGLVAGGCNIGVFTTGRGSVYGCKPAPCIKVSTNTELYDQMKDDIDINAGTVLDGKETVTDVGMRIFEKIISVANGEKTKSEILGIGDEEFAPWIIGPTF